MNEWLSDSAKKNWHYDIAPGVPSVWIHDACFYDRILDQEGCEESELTTIRLPNGLVRVVYLLTCYDCGSQTIISYTDLLEPLDDKPPITYKSIMLEAADLLESRGETESAAYARGIAKMVSDDPIKPPKYDPHVNYFQKCQDAGIPIKKNSTGFTLGN